MNILLTGDEAVARGAWEAGVSFASAYPGTPSTEILESIGELYGDDIVAEWAPNEKAALEAAIGASVLGGRALAAMKHVGVNVAADPLFTVAYTGITGGLVLVSADDPGLHSSQNEQDNRHFARAAKIAMLEPSDSQEAKDMVRAALVLSERFDTPVMLRLTTRICHSKSVVELGEREAARRIPYAKNPKKYDPVPALARAMHVKVEERLKALADHGASSPLNRIEMGGTEAGVISAGAAYGYAREVFGESASYLKLGLTFPLPMDLIRDFASRVKELYVIEELEPFIEGQIRAAGIGCVGKEKMPICGELNPDILRKAFLGVEAPAIEYDRSVLAARPPVLCAGCPHRGFFVELRKRKDAVISADIGCYGLSGNPPLNAKDFAFAMGGGFSVAHGAQKLVDKFGGTERLVGVMGDSTFFHSGMTSLLECAYNRSRTVLCILDNRITGMTGHQQNPGTGFDLMNGEAPIVEIEAVARALGIEHVRTVNPLRLKDVAEALDWAFAATEVHGSGPAVIVTRWPCALKKYSEADKAEFGSLDNVCSVNEALCIGCKACVRIGCPAVVFIPDRNKSSVDRGQCVGCEVCAQVCPKGAISREDR
jgi:indolepyruvate ferredoxin oxidoreductase alpha subunit